MSVTTPRSVRPLNTICSQASTPAATSASSTPAPSLAHSSASTPHLYDESVDFFENYHHDIYNSDTPPVGSTTPVTEDLLICFTCGTQFDVEDRRLLKRCRICDDPRQYVPPSGQSWTTLTELKSSPQAYKNKWKPILSDLRFWSIWTEPKLSIGQRCILIKTPLGNILWDCITFLDDPTVDWINSQGGVSAIVISHPHYYSTHLEWAETFDCPVYLSWEDKEWLNRLDRQGKARCFIEGKEEEIELAGEKTGVKALKLGGHFPGSLVVLAFGKLLVADTIVTTPAGLGDWSLGAGGGKNARPRGMNSYSFMWSIPNMIPLSAEEIQGMWDVLKGHEFESTHGAFVGTEVRDGGGGSRKGVKERVLESMQIQVKRIGGSGHKFLKEVVEEVEL